MSPAADSGAAALDPYEVLVADVRLMLAHALSTGRQVPAEWLELSARAEAAPLSPALVHRLARCHDGLSLLVAPATPRTLAYLAGSSWRPLPLMRRLALLAMLFLSGFVVLALDPDVGGAAADFETGSGHEMLVNLLFQLCAAGLGATFAALFSVYARLRDFSLDPRDEFANWIRVMLGLVSGLVLAQLAPVEGDGRAFGRPLLALLGGFSVDVVYQTLKRLVDVASSLVANSGDGVEAERARAEAREAQLRFGVAHQLVRLRQALPEGEAATAVDALVADLAPSGVPDAAPPPSPPEPRPDPEPVTPPRTAPARRRAAG